MGLHFGPPTDDPHGFHSLTCGYTGHTPDGPRCGKPPVIHAGVYFNDDGSIRSLLACAEHVDFVRDAGIIAEHPVFGSACCMPGSVWVLGPPSRCVIDDRGVRSQ